MGAVFREARDPSGARAAIKLLLPKWRAHDQLLERFAREARVLMRLTTPHVGKLLDVGNLDKAHGDLPYLVLSRYLEGVDLERVIEAARARPVPRGLRLQGADACDGLCPRSPPARRDPSPISSRRTCSWPSAAWQLAGREGGRLRDRRRRAQTSLARPTTKLTTADAPLGSPPVHVARADDGPGDRQADRHLVDGRAPLRVDHRTPPVSGRDRAPDVRRGHDPPSLCRCERTSRTRSPRGSSRSSSSACGRIEATATIRWTALASALRAVG